MSQQPRRHTAKGQPKIHRRKNEQVPKDFICGVAVCGKAYGSYAALYTHMKNKHPEIKAPAMPNPTKNRNGQPGRPKTKKNEQLDDQVVQLQEKDFTVCKICMKQECECLEDLYSKEKLRTIEIMSSEKFITLTSQIGSFNYQGFSWVRRTDDSFVFKTKYELLDDVQVCNNTYDVRCKLSEKIIEWLAFCSRYWDEEYINELYQTFYIIIFFQNYQRTLDFLKKNSHFPHMKKCIEKNPNQFKRIESLVRII